MSIDQSIQLLVCINLFVLGLSHFIRVKIWIDFFTYLSKMGNTGNIINALLALGMGSLITSFHHIWTWPMIIVTIYGLLLILKALLYLIFPVIGLKTIQNVKAKGVKLKWVGFVMCIISIELFYSLYDQGAFNQVLF